MAHHKAQPRNTPDDRLLTEKEVLERIPLNRSTVYRMTRDGRFPEPIQLTAARKCWRLSTIAAWIAAREANPASARLYFGRRHARRADSRE
jgi:predicted DNA-binding transcriptional regulator AlpA